MVSTMITSNGTVTEYEYDSCGHIVKEMVTAADGRCLTAYMCGEMLSTDGGYAHDAVSNRISKSLTSEGY